MAQTQPAGRDPYGELKQQAADVAVNEIRSGMVLGLGTGSTVKFALEGIGRKIRSGELSDISGIPSSIQTGQIARECGIPLTDFERHDRIDITIDGADEVDPNMNLIKGGGGALLREKVLAQVSRRIVIIVDESKLSLELGTLCPLPVEVVPFAWQPVAGYLKTELKAEISLRKTSDQQIFLTDQGNYILDCWFGAITHPGNLASRLERRAGIVEHGLFIGMATEVVVAGDHGIGRLKR